MSASKVMSVKKLMARVKIAHTSLRDKVFEPPQLRR